MPHPDKSTLKDIQDGVKELKTMRDYARQNGFAKTANHLNSILQTLDGPIRKDQATVAITAAKNGVPEVEKTSIFKSLLQQTDAGTYQPLHEAFKNFFSTRNKFENFLSHLGSHAPAEKKGPLFFSTKPAVGNKFSAPSAKETKKHSI